MISYTRTQFAHFHALNGNKIIETISVFFIHLLRDIDFAITCENQEVQHH